MHALDHPMSVESASEVLQLGDMLSLTIFRIGTNGYFIIKLRSNCRERHAKCINSSMARPINVSR
jgi:hypothetical protein